MSPTHRNNRTIFRWYTVTKAIVLFSLWLTLSGKVDALHLGYGVASVTVVMWITRDLMLTKLSPSDSAALAHTRWAAALTYPCWLLGQIVWANIAVAKLILSPRMSIAPTFLQLNTPTSSSIPQVILGNSITLTPGTVTLEADHGRFVIHALQKHSTDSLQALAKRVSDLFGEPTNGPIQVTTFDTEKGSERR